MLISKTLTRDAVSGRLREGGKVLTPQTARLQCPQHQSVRGSVLPRSLNEKKTHSNVQISSYSIFLDFIVTLR